MQGCKGIAQQPPSRIHLKGLMVSAVMGLPMPPWATDNPQQTR